MLSQYGRHWWVIMARGIVAMLFGALLLAWPDVSASAMAASFGVFSVLDGGCLVTGMVTGWRRPHAHLQGWLGTAGVVIGILALVWPSESAWVLPLIAARLVVSGLVDMISVPALRSLTGYERLLLADGIFTLVFGALTFTAAGFGMYSLLPALGIMQLINCSLLLVCGTKLRRLPRLPARYRLPIV